MSETPEPVVATATVSIQQLGEGNRIVLWADGSRHYLTMVSTSSEAAFLGGPRTDADRAAVR